MMTTIIIIIIINNNYNNNNDNNNNNNTKKTDSANPFAQSLKHINCGKRLLFLLSLKFVYCWYEDLIPEVFNDIFQYAKNVHRYSARRATKYNIDKIGK